MIDGAANHKTMNLIAVEACRDLVGEEQKGQDSGENGTWPETIKGGPKDLSELAGWPAPTLLFQIGETTHSKVARQAKWQKRPIEDAIVAATLSWLDKPNPLSR